MAEDEDGEGLLNLTLPQKLQLGAVGTGTIIFILTYTIAVLLNGFTYVNQWITSNPVPVAAYWSINIGLLPVYSKVDPREYKCVKQAVYKFIFWGGPFILFWIYYQFNPPTTGIDRLVSKLSYVFTFASLTGVILSGSYFKYKIKED